jgi:tryptophanyl-tRNA synthetase
MPRLGRDPSRSMRLAKKTKTPYNLPHMSELCFSGVQPSNVLHIGNYIGAIAQWVDVQKRFPCFFCIVNLHAMTVPQDPKALRRNSQLLAATYLACGLDPKRSHIFLQSEVGEHAELAWILGTIAKMAELERMTQYKDKAKKRGENVGVGLFTYPVLMAADILLYDTTVVPVGEDQLQHVELARMLARRFNQTYTPSDGQAGEVFVVPKPLIQESGARIMSLDDPHAKMSKSATSSLNYIALTDSDDEIVKKIKKAVTDSGSDIIYDVDARPAISNLMTIYHHATGKKIKEIEEEFAGKGYGAFKSALTEAVIAMVAPIRGKIEHYLKDPSQLNNILDEGRDYAKALAEKKMKTVREAVGLGR